MSLAHFPRLLVVIALALAACTSTANQGVGSGLAAGSPCNPAAQTTQCGAVGVQTAILVCDAAANVWSVQTACQTGTTCVSTGGALTCQAVGVDTIQSDAADVTATDGSAADTVSGSDAMSQYPYFETALRRKALP